MAGSGEGDRPYREASFLDEDGPIADDKGNAPAKLGGGEAAAELEKDDLLDGGFIDAERLAREGVPGRDAVGVRGAASLVADDAPGSEWLSSPCSDAAEVITESVSDAATEARRRKPGRIDVMVVDEDEEEKEGVREWWISIFCERLWG